jgi:hypothetical protein
MINIDEAIKRSEEVERKKRELYDICPATETEWLHCDGTKNCKTMLYGENKGCLKLAEEHKQIAEWLKELKKLKKLASCEDCVSRKAAKEDAWNLCLETSYDNEKVVEMLDDLPSVKPVACIGTVKFSKEDMQELVDDAVKELVLENAR